MNRGNRSMRAWLLLSVLLNVFLLGGIGGGLYQWWQHGNRVAASNPHGLRQFMQGLPQPQRSELVQVLRTTRSENQPLIRTGREARQAVVQQLQAAVLDRSALDADLTRARQADADLRGKVEAALVEFAATLPQEQRLKLANALEKTSAQRHWQ